jgi:2-polyprenyl-6-methoxyphenol hydroxylase-like FAD-dependent oxidoreductase
VVVVGGGFAGLSAAAALAGTGANVTVLEALDGVNPTFRGELLHPRGVRALATLGLKDAVFAAGAMPVRGFAAFASHAASPVILPYPRGSELGLTIEHGALVACFQRHLSRNPRVKIVRRARVRELAMERQRMVGVRTTDGQAHLAPLVVAADGRHSRMRKLLGIPSVSTLLSYSIALPIEGDVLPEPEHGHVFVGAPGPILAYGYEPGSAATPPRVRLCIDVPLTATTDPAGGHAPELLRRRKEALLSYLREEYAPLLPLAMRRAMLVALDKATMASAANHAIYTDACAVAGAALVGDSGGCSHPITATGMTTALHDVTTLAACVSEKGVTEDALVEYQRRRYRFVRAREAFTHALYDVLRGDGPGPRALQEGIFSYWRAGERGRRVSMDVLSGDEESVKTFATEYLRVVATSSWLACGKALREGGLPAAASRLRALADTARGGMGVAIGKALSTLAIERGTVLDPLPPQWPGARTEPLAQAYLSDEGTARETTLTATA